jgi:hypothetical protein
MIFVFIQSNNSKVAEARRDDALKGLSTAVQETARIQSLNTELQEHLLKQSDTISGLARKAIDTAIGGDSFCYMAMERASMDLGSAMALFVKVGEYPLYEITAWILDLENAGTLGDQIQLPLGNMMAGATSHITSTRFMFSGSDRRRFNVFFNARNGFWSQQLRYRRIGGKWLMAYQVWRQGAAGEGGPLSEHIDDGYPRKADGSVEW